MTTRDEWAAQFKAAREAISSQERFSEQTGIPRRTVSRWENGHTLPDENHATTLAALSPEMAAVIKMIPQERAHRQDLGRRVEALEAHRDEVDRRLAEIRDLSQVTNNVVRQPARSALLSPTTEGADTTAPSAVALAYRAKEAS